ncbi:MAG: biotin--[acetyl-CoA-carboxylase] ligase [Armatimonadota bacterium]
MSSECADLRARLGTRLIGSRWYDHDSLESTNLEALRLAQQGAPAGTVVRADTQTAGRGRLGRSWADLPGRCLLMSVLLQPPASAPGLLTAAAALAAGDAINALTGLSAALKWPNDLLVKGRKVGGVLAEGPARGMVAVGVGINVNGAPQDLPPPMHEAATFVSHEAGRALSIPALAESLAARLDAVYHLLVAGQARRVIEAIAARDCLAGRPIRARAGPYAVTGMALRWLEDGRLLIRDDHGHELALEAGEVTLR